MDLAILSYMMAASRKERDPSYCKKQGEMKKFSHKKPQYE